jgi:hypothetical protein
VIVLADPLGDAAGYMGTQSLATLTQSLPQAVSLAGYSKDYDSSQTAGVDGNCKVEEQLSDGTFGHNCSMEGGASGGALFLSDGNGGYNVAAVNTRGIDGGVFSNYSTANANISVWVDLISQYVTNYRQQYP